ncbi:MAG: hypothetical protein CL681_20775 [Blastopirellula sp.]|nr:hypothetical protein [Blastopirellula sp.]
MGDSAAAAEYERLREQLSAKYALVDKVFTFGDTEFTIQAVADPDAVLQEVAERSVTAGDDWDDQQPYWAELWQSAHALCHRCVSMELTGRRILDLGCGLGLTTAVLASRQANVVAVDSVAEALEFCVLNCWPWRTRVQTAQVDWRYDRLEKSFEQIVAADILYDRDHWPFIEAFWQAHLEDEGVIVVAEPGRHSADGFADWLRQRGWFVREELRVSHGVGQSARHRLLEITRREQVATWVSED